MYANGHEQGRSSKWEATPKYGHFTTRESGSPGFWKNSTRSCWSIRVWVSNLKFLAFFDKFCNIFYLKRFLKNSRIPFDTLGITTTNSIPTHHLLNKGFHYSPFPQLNDIVAKGNLFYNIIYFGLYFKLSNSSMKRNMNFQFGPALPADLFGVMGHFT